MSHTLYNTECIVLGSVDFGESNKYISLFTKEIGFVKALAKSVREEKSKLRYSLQSFSFTNISLVRGREIWRITGAEAKYNLCNDLRDNQNKLFTIALILNLLQRLVHGEEKNDYLFNTLSNCFDFIRENKINEKTLKSIEYLTVFRILYSLGYIAKKKELDEIFRLTEINEDLLKKTQLEQKNIVYAINNALKQAHL